MFAERLERAGSLTFSACSRCASGGSERLTDSPCRHSSWRTSFCCHWSCRRPPYYLLNYVDLNRRQHRMAPCLPNRELPCALPRMVGIRNRPDPPLDAVAAGPTPEHTDITNLYIGFAILGGMPALLLILAMLWRAFAWVGIAAGTRTGITSPTSFVAWCLGSTLFAHAPPPVSRWRISTSRSSSSGPPIGDQLLPLLRATESLARQRAATQRGIAYHGSSPKPPTCTLSNHWSRT